MIGLILYSLLAATVLVLVFWLAREKPLPEPWETPEEFPPDALEDPAFLNLSQRVFDPSDYRWVREELCFPQAAEILARDRKQLALKWLRALRGQFKELVRLPEPAADSQAPARAISWRLLALTLRFHLLLSYTTLVVRLFGPYHRLVPSLSGLRAFSLKRMRALGSRMLGARHMA